MSFSVDKHILKRYQLISKIGKGAYGIVYKAKDRETSKLVALKKCIGVFENGTDAQRAYREVFYLKSLRHVNIISLLNIHTADNNRDLYLVFPYFPSDLHAVIRSDILQDIHIQYIIYQLFISVYYIHSGSVLHRDLKPSNILIDSDCAIKICDFGLARSVSQAFSGDSVPASLMTDYVATRWYRPPEILLGLQRYTLDVDMWAIGCIFAELLQGKPLFPGSCSLNQLTRIINVTGYPSDEIIKELDSPFVHSLLDALPVSVKPSYGRASRQRMSSSVSGSIKVSHARSCPGFDNHSDQLADTQVESKITQSTPFIRESDRKSMKHSSSDLHGHSHHHKSLHKTKSSGSLHHSRSRHSSHSHKSDLRRHHSHSTPSSTTVSPSGSQASSLSSSPLKHCSPSSLSSSFSVLPSIASNPELSARFAYCTPSIHLVRRLSLILSGASVEAIDLLARCLSFSPSHRIRAIDALHHPYVAVFARGEGTPEKPPLSLPVAPVPHLTAPLTVPISDDIKFTVDEYRQRVYKLVRKKEEEEKKMKRKRKEAVLKSTSARETSARREGRKLSKGKPKPDGSKKRKFISARE
ncbi:Kinase, CMGC MAPK [Aduncisulcus paluster]|uniref:Mitogen-activated protein kinase n=1 Tax=Aduncisulcus paluster TaxID=2918883 RepID=A0ABQ5K4L8_9EUKA|nr:Kinase, CMGC MAPK [Aduncisulcus paluster]